MSTTEVWTIGRLLTWTTDYLRKQGSHSSRLDAEVLLAHAKQCERIELYTAFDEEPDDEVKAAFREMVKRRAEGTPVAYLVGYKEFYSTTFEVTPDVLIPRPETEHLVTEALDHAKALLASEGHSGQLRIADVGTGSGAIAVVLAKHLESALVTAIDQSEPALEVAQRNVQRHEVGDRVTLLHSDLLLGCGEVQFDLIVSNPPYVSDAEYEQLESTVKDHEPRAALVSSPNGYECLAEIARQSRERLSPEGALLLEFSPMLAETVDDWLPDGWGEPSIVKDLSGAARVLCLRPS